MKTSEALKIVSTINECRSLRNAWRGTGDSIGFVPTMGALHAGHLSLVTRAQQECSKTVVSIFINPTQFNNPQDLQNYPRTLNQDLALLERAGVSCVFLPKADEIYQDQFRFTLHENQLSQLLCGPGRPGHFDGILTVVLKLLNIVGAKRAYFGEKDFQQLKLIEDMSRALFLDCEIVACPTEREMDGLAMSSRNLRLTPAERELAPKLYQVLRSGVSSDAAKDQLSAAGFSVEYVEEHWGRRFIAAQLGQVRLIDNVAL